jgi:hypothetical protein
MIIALLASTLVGGGIGYAIFEAFSSPKRK